MKIKLLHPISGPEGTFKAGDEPELSELLTRSLLKDGHAIEITAEISLMASPQYVRPIQAKKARKK